MTLKPEYQAWIDAYVTDHPHLRGSCASAANAMILSFTELRRACGWVVEKRHVHLYENEPGDFSTGHWWCVDPDGAIVDPTSLQFDNLTNCVYVEYNERKHGPMPVGKCPNCGWLIYPKDNAGGVHKECEAEFRAYLDRSVARMSAR